MDEWANEQSKSQEIFSSMPIPSRSNISLIEEVSFWLTRVHWHLLASCLTLNKPLNISNLQFLICRVGIMISISGSLWKLKVKMYIICISTLRCSSSDSCHYLTTSLHGCLPHSLPREIIIFKKHLLCGSYCPKYFTSAKSFNPHTNPRSGLLMAHSIGEEMSHQAVRELAPGHKTGDRTSIWIQALGCRICAPNCCAFPN